ncbi:MAG: hypothetical protein ACPGR8_14380 [Limisphaerales bacterium]
MVASSAPKKAGKLRAALLKSTARWRRLLERAEAERARLKREPAVWNFFDPRHDELWARWEKASAEARTAGNMCTLEDHCLAKLAGSDNQPESGGGATSV